VRLLPKSLLPNLNFGGNKVKGHLQPNQHPQENSN
jgi:hypothetical protein